MFKSFLCLYGPNLSPTNVNPGHGFPTSWIHQKGERLEGWYHGQRLPATEYSVPIQECGGELDVGNAPF